jgi:hypothetical protein
MGLFSDFFGGQSRSDINAANTKATNALTSGYNTATGLYGQAASNYSPYTQTGQQANTFYANALGLNGNAARQGAENTITSDPLWSGKFALDSNNVLKSMNARGLNASGAGALAGQRVLTEDYNSALGNYANLGAQGLTAANGQAGVYGAQAGNAMDYGQSQAGNAINYGNAMAQTRNMGLNNLLGVLGTATAGYNAFMNPGAALAKKAVA